MANEPEAVTGNQGAEAAPDKEQPPGSGRQFWDGLLKEEHQQAEALALAAMGKVPRLMQDSKFKNRKRVTSHPASACRSDSKWQS